MDLTTKNMETIIDEEYLPGKCPICTAEFDLNYREANPHDKDQAICKKCYNEIEAEVLKIESLREYISDIHACEHIIELRKEQLLKLGYHCDTRIKTTVIQK